MNSASVNFLNINAEVDGSEPLTSEQVSRVFGLAARFIVLSQSETDPPTAPAVGDLYIVAHHATGVWDTRDYQVAGWLGNRWAFIRPALGMEAYVVDDLVLMTCNGVNWDYPGGVALDLLWDAKGDLAVGVTSDLAGRLAVGTNGHVLTADSAEVLGVKWAAAAGGSLSDGDKGDVTVSGSGATWTIDAGVVTLAKQANLAQDQFIGRTTASTGVPQTATITAAARTVLDDTTVGAMVDTLGGASSTGTGGIARTTSPTFTTPALGTPSAGVLTNCTGTAAGLTAGNVTTNANLTGPVTSVGNATTIADAELAALAGLTSAADKLPYFTGSGTAALADLSSAARTVIDDASVSAMVDTLGGASATGTGGIVRATSPTLVTPALGTPSALVGTNITGTAAGLTAGSCTGFSGTHSGTSSGSNTGDQTAASLGLVIGSQVQAYDAELAAIAGLTSAADKGIQFTGSGTAATFDLTAAAKTVLDDSTVAAMVDTLGGASSTGTGGIARATSPTFVTPALGTPSALVGTNISGTAASLTAGLVTTVTGAQLRRPTLMRPPWFIVQNVSSTSAAQATTIAYAYYLGQADRAYTTVNIRVRVTTAITATIAWAEISCCTGALSIGATTNMTNRGFLDVSAVWNALGVYTHAITVSGIAAGDDIWAVFSTSTSGTLPLFRGALPDELGSGFFQKTAGSTRPSTMGAATAFGVGSTAAAPPWIDWNGS